MNHLSLFTGIGGLDLAAEWAGFHTVGQVEIDDYCNKVLQKHWPDVPRWRDVFDLTGEEIKEHCGAVDIISAGFPCQPYSEAGGKRGNKDERCLWGETVRLLGVIKPRWFVGENVRMFAKLGLDEALSDLVDTSYTPRAVIFPASAVGAPHERNRLFLVAHSPSVRLPKSVERDEFVFTEQKGTPRTWNRRRMDKPGIQRVVDGIPAQMDRLKCLGNAVVPQQAYPIFKAIAAQGVQGNE